MNPNAQHPMTEEKSVAGWDGAAMRGAFIFQRMP